MQARKASALIPILIHRLKPLPPVIARASEFSLDLDHPIYACFYLELAERENLTPVTADARLSEAAGRLVGVRAEGLG